MLALWSPVGRVDGGTASAPSSISVFAHGDWITHVIVPGMNSSSLIFTNLSSQWLPSPWNAESSEPWIIEEFNMWLPGNLLPESPPSLNQGRPNSECAVFSEMFISCCRTTFLAFSHVHFPSSFYFQLPTLYLEDAVYSFPLKLTCPGSHIQILIL